MLQFLSSRRDSNAASLVCKSCCQVEALTRSELFIGNCYFVSPRWAMSRFPRVRAVAIKGKSRFVDFNLMPLESGAHFAPWVAALSSAYPWLEKSLPETHVSHQRRSEISRWVFPFLQRTRPCLLRWLWYMWLRRNSQEVQVLESESKPDRGAKSRCHHSVSLPGFVTCFQFWWFGSHGLEFVTCLWFDFGFVICLWFDFGFVTCL